MLTEKDYCDYDTCVALRELGYYDPIQSNTHLTILLYSAQKWLREEKKIEVVVLGENYIGGPYHPDIYNEAGPAWFDNGEGYNSYESALLEGIKEAVKILK